MPPRLRRVDVSGPGLGRKRQGDQWVYADAGGQPISDPAVIARINALVIPPAWQDVWISPVASGHIQATGVDIRKRRQYRYHDAWRLQRDREKFDRVLDFAAALPTARSTIAGDLARPHLPRERALACAVRLLDLGFFRIGSEEYAEANETYGLATMRRTHVRVSRDGEITFDYIAKSGKRRQQAIRDDAVLPVVRTLKRRRGGGEELLAYQSTRGMWTDVRSGDVNDYLREVTGVEATAKDFRTWNATCLAAVGLSVSVGVAASVTGRKKAITRVVKEVADRLGNTPAVCKSSYIDPRIIDLYQGGVTVQAVLDDLGDEAVLGQPAFQGSMEEAVLALLREPPTLAAEAG